METLPKLGFVVNPVNHDNKFKFSDKQMKSLFKQGFISKVPYGR